MELELLSQPQGITNTFLFIYYFHCFSYINLTPEAWQLLYYVLDCTLPSAAIIYFVMCLLAPVEPGKFDLVYQNADGSEIVEYAVTHGSQVLKALLNVTLGSHTHIKWILVWLEH